MKTYLSYVPHGVDHNIFYPIDEIHPKFNDLQNFKNQMFRLKEFDFVLLFNSRNIRRKSIPDTLLAFKTFLDLLPKEKAEKCAFVLHTQPIDENGTNLHYVADMLFGDDAEKHIFFSSNGLPPELMNFLYNSADATILLSSNEGWGLSMTESVMSGKMIIGNVTGGIQDQMRFEDENGDWIKLTENFSSNHLGKYKKCGKWAVPVFPSNISIQGSVPTPAITDDRVDFRDAAYAIKQVYDMSVEERKERGLEGRRWMMSDEASMTSEKMCNNLSKSVDYLFENWKPREGHEIIKIAPRKKKFNKYPISF